MTNLNDSRREYASSASPPSSPQRGWLWNEIDANGDLVMEWFWNGTYWLSRQTIYDPLVLAAGGNNVSGGTNLFTFGGNIVNTENLFLIGFQLNFATGATHNGSNYFTFAVNTTTPNILVWNASAIGANANTRLYQSASVFQAATNLANGGTGGFQLAVGVVGAPTAPVPLRSGGAVMRKARA